MIESIKKSNQLVNFNTNEYPDIPLKELSKKVFIPEELLRCYNSWYQINNKWYYFKIPEGTTELVNELIGEKLAHHFGLKTVHYLLAKDQSTKQIGLISENYRKKNYKYFSPDELPNYSLEKSYDGIMFESLKKHCKSEQKYKQLILQLLKLTILDFYLSQTDRNNGNLIFEKGKTTNLAPLLDYSESFNVGKNHYEKTAFDFSFNNHNKNFYLYANALFFLGIPSKQYYELVEQYPEIKDYLEQLLDIDLIKLLQEIEYEYSFKISREIKYYYSYYDINKKEFVRKKLKTQ